MDLTPQEILEENDVFIISIQGVKHLVHNGITVIRPAPEKIYQKLIDKFGITEPRFKNFK